MPTLYVAIQMRLKFGAGIRHRGQDVVSARVLTPRPRTRLTGHNYLGLTSALGLRAMLRNLAPPSLSWDGKLRNTASPSIALSSRVRAFQFPFPSVTGRPLPFEGLCPRLGVDIEPAQVDSRTHKYLLINESTRLNSLTK
jgi:hypothetical protein